jgi:hypothetical protein
VRTLVVALLLCACRTPPLPANGDAGGGDLRPPDLLTPDLAPPPCDCNGGCATGARCLQSQAGGLTPNGVMCDTPTGPPECRPRCDAGACPASRPFCVAIGLSAGCCSDAFESVRLCCANADAKDNSNCR